MPDQLLGYNLATRFGPCIDNFLKSEDYFALRPSRSAWQQKKEATEIRTAAEEHRETKETDSKAEGERMPSTRPAPGAGHLEEAQQQAEAAAATLIERKFKEPANLEVQAAVCCGVVVACAGAIIIR